MAEHPTLDELQDFLLGRASSANARKVVAHLLRGCPSCEAELTPEVEAMLGNAPIEDGYHGAYDEALDRAIAAWRWHGPGAAEARARSREALARVEAGGIEELSEARSELKGIAAFEALLERSWALRHDDPSRMLELAHFATLVADRLSPEVYDCKRLADLKCRAWAALGNAFRVADDLDSAEWALGRAAELHLLGTRDEVLAARLLELQASLCGAQRRFPAAQEALDAVCALHRRRGDNHLVGRTLIKKGLYTGYANDPERAVRLLVDGLALIDRERDPQLALSAIHNIAWFLMDLGRFRQARNLVWENRWRYHEHGGHIDRLKLRWLQGLIDKGLGKLASAEEALKEARKGFGDAGMRYHAALTGLDLASIFLRRKRPAEARDVVLEATAVFIDLRIQREALGAVLMLKSVFEAGVEARAILDDAIHFLRRIEYDPTLTFSAWFL